MRRLLVFTALLFALPAQAEVTFDWVEVGDPGNAPDIHGEGYGSVAYTYQISKYEVTNAQYAEFLNAVAATDTYDLYNTNMANAYLPYFGGITRSGTSGGYSYSAIAGRENMPVNWVSFYDALRFANWLHNGQPTGAQDSTTTEDGAYTMITESFPDGPFITRNADATVVLTSEDEWYKAAYYDAAASSYFDYPAGSDTQTTCALPGATANTANCDLVVYDLTDVGSYTGAASPNGTFDQGGNVWEWNELIGGWYRILRGGSGKDIPSSLSTVDRRSDEPTGESFPVGFRVAKTVPAPPVPSLGPIGLLLVAAGLLGFGVYRRIGA